MKKEYSKGHRQHSHIHPGRKSHSSGLHGIFGTFLGKFRNFGVKIGRIWGKIGRNLGENLGFSGIQSEMHSWFVFLLPHFLPHQGEAKMGQKKPNFGQTQRKLGILGWEKKRNVSVENTKFWGENGKCWVKILIFGWKKLKFGLKMEYFGWKIWYFGLKTGNLAHSNQGEDV